MADETDFLDLYAKLRLDPGCSLEAFKQAYRRHVAMWHPDRRLGSRADQLAAARLQRLTAQYGAAMEFHRRHGRLPGAPGVSRAADMAHGNVETAAPTHEAAASAAALPRVTQRALAIRWWVMLALLGAGAVTWSMWPASDGLDTEAGQEPVAIAAASAPAALSTLSLGMTPDEVVGIEGEPTRRADGRWEYGPSWIRFEQGVVVDWYSSPLRRLRTDSPHPGP
ncbi:J domain-containing protein [Luteibacter yeojuensis]